MTAAWHSFFVGVALSMPMWVGLTLLTINYIERKRR